MGISIREAQGELLLEGGDRPLRLSLRFKRDGSWLPVRLRTEESSAAYRRYGAAAEGLEATLVLKAGQDGESLGYRLSFSSRFPTRLKLRLELLGGNDLFHLIPANIFGDNNIDKARSGEYPMLTDRFPDDPFCAPYWEFRADRASHPVSLLCSSGGAAGVSIDPYSPDGSGGFIRNGVFAELPGAFGVTVGYANEPVTFVNKREWAASTSDSCLGTAASGRIFALSGGGRRDAHRIVRALYAEGRERPEYRRTLEEAARGLVDSFIEVNWSEEIGNYTNRKCLVPEAAELLPWRQLAEIGWTAGGVMAYPFAVAEHVLGLDRAYFRGRKTYREILDGIAGSYNGASGFLNDVTDPRWRPGSAPSAVNGWWADFGLSADCHCAYTNGSAVAYTMKTLRFMKRSLGATGPDWLRVSLRVLDTVAALQDTNGSYGYSYSQHERKVLDREGFAGCWFAEAMAYAYEETGDRRYLDSARKAMDFYYRSVRELRCWGTPMDTWKSVDEEGNLAFIRSSRALHEITGEPLFLEMLEAGAEYEYLWKYGFRTRPEAAPLKGSAWNSCGGSVTSVSNPHIHPMGLLVLEDLDYLAERTGDPYHADRAEDTLAFMMNCMELYPETSGYGRYGVLTERFCPSDGLLIERFSDGSPSSLWFSYNGWAAAAALEGIAGRLLRERSGSTDGSALRTRS